MTGGRSGGARAWGAFALLAAVPLGLVIAIVFRAASAEGARVRGEAAAHDAAVVARVRDDFGREWIAALGALDRIPSAALDVDVGEAKERDRLEAMIRGMTPAFADPVVVGPTGDVLVPASAKASPPSEACEGARAALSTSAREAAARRVLAECTELRGVTGRFLFPLLAVELGGVSLEGWVSAHEAALGAEERSVLRRRVLEATREPVRSEAPRIVLRLDRAVSDRQAIVAALTDPVADDARPGPVRVRSGRALSALRFGGAGVGVGYVVHAGALARLAAPERMAITVRTRGEPADVRVARELFFGLSLRDPNALEVRAVDASRRTLALGLAGAGATLALAALLFARARRAEALADLRTDFVAAVSHELRTPVASVRMLAELLERGDVAADERSEVDRTLAAESRRLADTLDRMLRFGALSRGRLSVTKERTPVRPVVEAAAARFAAAHPGRAVEVDVDPALLFDVDAGLVGLVLDNLLGNAAKYAPDGGPYRVWATRSSGVVFLRVVDHGPGIDARARARVFRPFERADDRLSRATEGTGVGLALVRGIARAHGGDASVEATPGGGASFVVRFPDDAGGR